MMAVPSQHQLFHGFMYTSTWTGLVLKSRKNIRGFEGVFLLLVGFLWFLEFFFGFGLGGGLGLSSALDSSAPCLLML